MKTFILVVGFFTQHPNPALDYIHIAEWSEPTEFEIKAQADEIREVMFKQNWRLKKMEIHEVVTVAAKEPAI